MKQFVSFSKYPSNNGKYFYTNFFKLYNINAEYNPLAATEDNILDMIKHAVSQKVTGISISMPFKQKVIPMLDYAETDVIKYNSCNTIVIRDNKLHGYNTDIEGITNASNYITYQSVAILGDGAMGTMFAKHLSTTTDCTINMYSRKLQNWDKRHDDTDVVINCTSFGTANIDSPLNSITNKKLVIDLAIKKHGLHQQCIEENIRYVSGSEFYKHQFLKQFMLYTGVLVNELEFDKIEAEKNDY
jgi:shikimate dehydrogenase